MDHTYKITEIVGSSPDGMDAAIRNGIARASKTLRNLDWFEVTDIRGRDERGRHRVVPGDDEGRVPPRRRRLTSPITPLARRGGRGGRRRRLRRLDHDRLAARVGLGHEVLRAVALHQRAARHALGVHRRPPDGPMVDGTSYANRPATARNRSRVSRLPVFAEHPQEEVGRPVAGRDAGRELRCPAAKASTSAARRRFAAVRLLERRVGHQHGESARDSQASSAGTSTRRWRRCR